MTGPERIAIEAVTPQIDGGRYPVKRVTGEELVVEADIFCDGHDEIGAALLYRRQGEEDWRQAPMLRLENDRWRGRFRPTEPGNYSYTLVGWVDRFATWQRDLGKREAAGQETHVELQVGMVLIEQAAARAPVELAVALRRAAAALALQAGGPGETAAGCDRRLADLMAAAGARGTGTRYRSELPLRVDRGKALFSSWYELFPRSLGKAGVHGTLRDCIALLPEISAMGFDVLYFPPIHPIGASKRKGKGNATLAEPGEPGSPWAIGSAHGGHKALHPELGSLADFRALVSEAGKLGVEIALDLAFQCSPDHPYLKEHPEWFLWRPDGSVQYAENPPKKYQDIVPFDFETSSWLELWEELRSVVFFWMDQGVRIFRVDNPHTKPFGFWEWLIGEAKGRSAEVVFLAEAFTRPKVVLQLAKAGFDQSYTYFAWRSGKQELSDYLSQLVAGELREVMRPNLWPNTPDILTRYLQLGGPAAFAIRLVLAATLSASYGIYGPPFELCVAEACPDSEEYLSAEKYQLRHWDRDAPGNLKRLITTVNRLRREHPPLQQTNNLSFYPTDNDQVLFYGKWSEQRDAIILVAVNLDPFHPQRALLQVPLAELGIEPGASYLVQDLLSGDNFLWSGTGNAVQFDPGLQPARIFRVRAWARRESDYDYYL